MTIAVGFLCADGIVVAADTCIITSDGKKQDGPKVGTAHNKSGTYAIANSAEDGNAGNTLAVKILKDLEQNTYDKPADVEAVVADHMTQWWAAFGQNKPPIVQFVLGSVMKGVPRLYFCEPPNTVYQKMDYVGIGSGSSTTDPLVATLFPGYDVTARVRLWHIAYLFYRAKRDDAWCGGHTTPIYIPLDGRVPMYIAFWDMGDAEKLGPDFDLYLRETLKCRLTANDDDHLRESMGNLAQVMRLTSKSIMALRFSPLDDDV